MQTQREYRLIMQTSLHPEGEMYHRKISYISLSATKILMLGLVNGFVEGYTKRMEKDKENEEIVSIFTSLTYYLLFLLFLSLCKSVHKTRIETQPKTLAS